MDDNADAVQAMAGLCRMHAYACSVALSGPQSLACAMVEQPAVVIVDIGLPGLDGFAVAKATTTTTATTTTATAAGLSGSRTAARSTVSCSRGRLWHRAPSTLTS